jgi:hypothetical protein
LRGGSARNACHQLQQRAISSFQLPSTPLPASSQNLMFNSYLTENIMFSEEHEVDRKVKPKVSAGLSGNVMKYGFP